MAKIYEFPKIKKESSEAKPEKIITRINLSPELEKNFIFKFAWIVDVLHSLRKSGSYFLDIQDVEMRRKLLYSNSNEEIINLTMKTTEQDIKLHPSYYEALTDIIMERKLNKPTRY